MFPFGQTIPRTGSPVTNLLEFEEIPVDRLKPPACSTIFLARPAIGASADDRLPRFFRGCLSVDEVVSQTVESAMSMSSLERLDLRLRLTLAMVRRGCCPVEASNTPVDAADVTNLVDRKMQSGILS